MGSIFKKFKKNSYTSNVSPFINVTGDLSFDDIQANYPFELSGEIVKYICPKCKKKIDAPIEAILEFEQEDEWNGLPISTPPYVTCPCGYDKVVPIDYHSKRGFHHVYNID